MPKGVYVRTEQAKRNIGIARRLRLPCSEDTRRKISMASTGRVLSAESRRKINEKLKGHKNMTTEGRKRISESNRRRKWSADTRAKHMVHGFAHLPRGRPKGYKPSEETKAKIGNANRGRIVRPEVRQASSGEKAWAWKGGVSPEHKRIRSGADFRLWRKLVYERDAYTCKKCGSVGGRLHPHHILNFSDNVDLRFSVENGITLCISDHTSFHRRYGRRNNTREQLEEFLRG